MKTSIVKRAIKKNEALVREVRAAFEKDGKRMATRAYDPTLKQAYDEGHEIGLEEACPFEPNMEACPYTDIPRREVWAAGYKDGCANEPKAMLFQTYSRAAGRLTGHPLPQANAYAIDPEARQFRRHRQASAIIPSARPALPPI